MRRVKKYHKNLNSHKFSDDLQMKKDNKKFYENFLQHISKLKRNYYPSEPCWLYDSIIWKYLNVREVNILKITF